MKGKQENPLQHWNKIQNWSSYLSKRTSQIEEAIKALQSVNLAMLDKGVLKELISTLANLKQFEAIQPKKTADKITKPTSAFNFESSNELIQLMNSPGMSEIIKEVFKNKRKW